MCDSLSAIFDSEELSDGGGGTCGETWRIWRPAPAIKGLQVLERMGLRETTSLRRLATCRAEQVGFARFFHNPNVTVEEILATAGGRAAPRAGTCY